MEQVVAQNKAELEQAGWAFQSEELPPEIPFAVVSQDGDIEGDILSVIRAALELDRPFHLTLVSNANVRMLATYWRQVGEQIYFYAYTGNQVRVIITLNGDFVSWD